MYLSQVGNCVQMPRSPAVRRQRPNVAAGTTRTPTSTRKAPVKRIYEAIKEEGLSLPTFLYALFESDETFAVRLASQFYSSHAPRELIEIWRQKLRRRSKWDASFIEGAVDVVVYRTRRDLRRSSNGVIGQVDPPPKRPAYQFPHNRVTQANIEHVIDRGFLGNYVDHAKPLTRFLEDVLKKDERKNKGKGKRLNEDEERTGNKDYNVLKHKDNGKDVAEDEEDVEKEEDAKEEDVEKMDLVDMVESQKVVLMAGAVEVVSDAEEEDAVKVEDKVKSKNDAPTRYRPHRNPSSVQGCIAAMLLFMTSQKCNAKNGDEGSLKSLGEIFAQPLW
ncbi:hypothetical protein BGZ96_003976, partial [Linnemannia gamsii]